MAAREASEGGMGEQAVEGGAIGRDMEELGVGELVGAGEIQQREPRDERGGEEEDREEVEDEDGEVRFERIWVLRFVMWVE